MIGSVSYARAGREQKEDLVRRSWDGHRSWISELRRADAARARSSQCSAAIRVTIGHCRRRERKKEREPVATCQDEPAARAKQRGPAIRAS